MELPSDTVIFAIAGIGLTLIVGGLILIAVVFGVDLKALAFPEQVAQQAPHVGHDAGPGRGHAAAGGGGGGRRRQARHNNRGAEADNVDEGDGADGSDDDDDANERRRRRRQQQQVEEAGREEQMERAARLAARKAKDDYKAAQRQAEFEAQERAEEAAKAAKAEAERREREAFRKLMGIDEDTEKEAARPILPDGSEALANFIATVKRRKAVAIDELACAFSVKSSALLARLTELEASGQLAGIVDDRGRFINVTPQEWDAVAAYVKAEGRVSKAQLSAESGRLIKLQGLES